MGIYSTLTTITIGALLPVAGAGYLWLNSPNLLSALLQSEPKTKIDARSLVVQQTRSLAELATVQQTIETVLPASATNNVLGLVPQETSLLYIAHGEVKAGVSLEVSPDRITQEGNTVQIRLPAPQILSIAIDPSRSKVWDSQQDWFASADPAALLNQTQKTAIERIRESVCKNGILDEASDRAKQVILQLIAPQLPSSVKLQVQIDPAISCL